MNEMRENLRTLAGLLGRIKEEAIYIYDEDIVENAKAAEKLLKHMGVNLPQPSKSKIKPISRFTLCTRCWRMTRTAANGNCGNCGEWKE